MIDFMNLKIKSVQSFENAHKDRMHMCVHKDKYSYIYKHLYICIIFLF
jgi:hypothetical protein